jgi:hypothetical protein
MSSMAGQKRSRAQSDSTDDALTWPASKRYNLRRDAEPSSASVLRYANSSALPATAAAAASTQGAPTAFGSAASGAAALQATLHRPLPPRPTNPTPAFTRSPFASTFHRFAQSTSSPFASTPSIPEIQSFEPLVDALILLGGRHAFVDEADVLRHFGDAPARAAIYDSASCASGPGEWCRLSSPLADER